MEENKDYHVYRYGDHLVPGAKLSIEHSVSCEYVDISSLIAEGTGRLSVMLQESHDNEQKAYDIVVAAAKQWEQQAVTTQLLNRALEYLRTPEVAHTSNQWKPNPRNDEWEEISNRVYKMNCNIREDTAYDRSTGPVCRKRGMSPGICISIPPKMDSIFISPGRIINAIRIKPLRTSTWLVAKKRMRICLRRFPRRFRNSMSSISWYMVFCFPVIGSKARNAPPPNRKRFRTAVFLHLRTNLLF